ncbi:MAG: ABC transporter ATP-binding protein [Gemmataceae bacterium]
MERAAFARAIEFLRHHPVATWSAIVAGILSALFFLFLIVLLALFADLMVNRGEIPTYFQAPATEKQAFDTWLSDLDHGENGDQATALSRRASDLGLEKRWLALVRPREVEKLTTTERETRRQLLWMLHLPDVVEAAAGADAGEAVRDNLKEQFHKHDALAVINRNLPDFGILSLVVRSRSSLHGWPASLVASWSGWTWANGNTGYLQGLFLLAVVVAVCRAGLLFLSNYTAAWATLEAVTRMRRSIYHQTYRLGALAFQATGPSEAVGIVTRQVESVHQGLFAWLTVFFREPVKFGLLLLFAMLVHFWLALAFLLFALLVWLVGGQIAVYFRRQGRAADLRAADQLAHLQESLRIMRLVKVYLMERFNQGRVERILRLYSEAQLERYRGEAIYRPAFTLLGLLAALLLLFVAGMVVLSGYLGVTSGMVLATVVICMYWPVVSFLAARRALKRSRQAAFELFDFLARQGGVGQVVEAEFLPALSRQLEFDNVSFREPATNQKLLDGISFAVRAGERIGLVGPDDAEKHALVYLLPRFLDPSGGEIRIDRKNIRWVTLDSLRAQIALVMQHNMVFSDTVANNIGGGDPACSLPRIVEAAKVAHAHQFIQKLPQGYETVIGEQGQALSPGEKFLIALARAILRDPAILVIEEPIALNDDFKALIDDTFSRVLPGRTVVFLPHRLSTIRGCDRLLLLHQGRIEAAGEHRDLLAKSDLYRHLQYLEFNEFAPVGVAPAEAGVS